MSFFGDIRDKYVGRWNYTINGSITLFGIPQVPYEVFQNRDSVAIIRKSGINGLEISLSGSPKLFKLNGNKLSADPDFDEDGDDGDGIETQYKNYYSGHASESLIEITRSIEGIWRNRWGENGTAQGSAVIILRR